MASTSPAAAQPAPREHRPASTFWTDDPTRDQRMRKMRADGIPSSAIAAVLGCSRNAVISRALRKGAPLPSKAVTTAPVQRQPKRDEQIIALWNEGTVVGAIVAACGVSTNTVKGVIARAVKAGLAVRHGRGKAQSLPHADAARVPAPAVAAAPSPPASAVVDVSSSRLFAEFPVALQVDALRSDTCRYPTGDIRTNNLRFCCAPVRVGKAYCATHYALCCTGLVRMTPPSSRAGALPSRAA